MILNPPLRRNGVEVTALDKTTHVINSVVFIEAYSPLQVKTPEIQSLIKRKLNDMVVYLTMEGYIDQNENWFIKSGVVIQSP